MSGSRAILHVDMDAFYASVEQLDDPSLRGRPVLVGYDGPRGVVAAASYEARKFGCHSAQPMVQAKRLCPHAAICPVRFDRYHELSDQLRAILLDYSPLVEPISLDEAWVDVTASLRLHGSGEHIASEIKRRVREQLGLTCSVGVAPNKFLAKLASDLNKPDGLTIITSQTIDAVLPPLPVTRIWGVGPKTAEQLARRGVRTIADIRRVGLPWLQQHFGESGEHYHRLAYGLDDRDVSPDGDAKSIGQEETFGVDLVHLEEILTVLLAQVEHVAARVRRHNRRAGAVSLKIRFGDFKTITRSATLREPTDQTSALWNAARELLEKWASESFAPVRLIGVQATALTGEDPQLALFTDASSEKRQKVDRVVDAINERFGDPTVFRGVRKR